MRIVTYKDPRYLQKNSYWNELREYPHLCISQTLVQGLSQRYKRTEFTVLNTINKFLGFFYSEIYNNSDNEVRQYLDLVSQINLLENKHKNVFLKNKYDVFKSLKFFCEAEVKKKDLNFENHEELEELFKLYELSRYAKSWNVYENTKDKTIEVLRNSCLESIKSDLITELRVYKREKNYEKVSLKEIMEDGITLKEELKGSLLKEKQTIGNSRKRKNIKVIINRLDHYLNILESPELINCNKIVLVGIHRFTAPILRFVKHLENIGVEPIFLINYNQEFEKIYSTWDEVYKWTNKKIEIDESKIEITHSVISEAMISLIEGDFKNLNELIKNIKNINLYKFDNMSSFATYVSNIYEIAEKESKETDGQSNSSKILAKMSEQFYSVDGELINSLLKVYYPNQFGERHFLAYPIGQFILGLFNMWDSKEKKLKIEQISLKTCLSVNLWSEKGRKAPLALYEKVQVYFSNVKNIDEFIERIESLKKNINKIKTCKDNRYEEFEVLSYFNLTIDELDYLALVIMDINYIAIKIFNNKDNTKDIKNYYKEVIKEIAKRNKESNALSEDELEFVSEIKERLNSDGENIDGNHAIEEVRELLHYYLSIRNDDESSNWIVRDFEQLDGAILLADPNAEESWGNKNIYHYAELSNNNMKSKRKRILPWPLTEEMFTEKNMIVNSVIKSQKEYNNFLRYNLFYGLYFFDGQLNISYVENLEENDDLYYFLKMLNIKEQLPYLEKDLIDNEYKNEINVVNELISLNLTASDVYSFSFCKFRYIFEQLIDEKALYNNDFLIKQYLKVFIAIKFIKHFSKPITVDNLNKELDNYMTKILIFFPYLNKEVDIPDLKVGILSKLKKWTVEGEYQHNKIEFKEYTARDFEYHDILKNYIYKSFSDGEKKENIMSYNRATEKIIKKAIIELIRSNEIDNKIVTTKCDYCKYKEICINNI